MRPVSSCCRQGSLLGPLLFLLASIDVARTLANPKLYADDTTAANVDVENLQPQILELERASARMVREVEAQLAGEQDPCTLLKTRADENAKRVLESWQALTCELIAKYSDGYINPPAKDRTLAPTPRSHR